MRIIHNRLLFTLFNLLTFACLPLHAADPKRVGPSALTASAPDLSPIPSRMKHGTVSVKNFGTATAGKSIVTVVCKKVGRGSCAEHPAMAKFTNPAYPNALVVKVKPLKPGQVFNYKLPFWNAMVWPAGKYSFSMKADASGAINELNETNNKKSAIITFP